MCTCGIANWWLCRHGGAYKSLCTCLKHKLVHHDNGKFDAYRLTNLGYDFLAINTLRKRGMVASVGRQIGVGKESDLFEVRSQATHGLSALQHTSSASILTHTYHDMYLSRTDAAILGGVHSSLCSGVKLGQFHAFKRCGCRWQGRMAQ